MRFSIFIGDIRIFSGSVNDAFDELKNELLIEGYLFIDNQLFIESVNLISLQEKYSKYLNNRIETSYIEHIDGFNDLRSWAEFGFNGNIYKLYAGTEEKNKLLYSFIFYQALQDANDQAIKIFIEKHNSLGELPVSSSMKL